MKFCQHCGKEIDEKAVVCIHCGQSVEPAQTGTTPAANDGKHLGFTILAFFVPIFGLIYYVLKNKEYPIRSKACLIAGIVGFVLNFILSFIVGFIDGLMSVMG